MAKIKVLKKIAALVTAVVLVVCFAATVSAAPIITTTTVYTEGNNEKVDVDVSVTNIDEGIDYVTYYAATHNATTDKDDIFYIDQQTVADGRADFKFRVDAEHLGKEVKIGFSNISTTASKGEIAGYKVSVKGVGEPVTTIPNNQETLTTTFKYTPSSGYTVDTANVKALSGASVTTASYNDNDGILTVTLTAVTGDVVLDVPEETEIVSLASAELIDAGGIVVGDNAKKDEAIGENGDATDEANADAAGDRKLTVVGKVNPSAATYGIIVSENAIAGGKLYSESKFESTFAAEIYEAKAKRDSDDLFAVQLIDTSNETSEPGEVFVESGKTYNVAVYVFDGNNYVVSDSNTVTISNAVEITE